MVTFMLKEEVYRGVDFVFNNQVDGGSKVLNGF